MPTPYQKLIKGLQEEYASNPSVELLMTKTEFQNKCYEYVGLVLPSVRNARKMMIENGLLVWPEKTERVVLHLEKTKKEKI